VYLTRPNLILGFHGCETDDQHRLLKDISYFKKSSEDFDWLGHGMYFWENNPQRALLWAQGKKKAGQIITPAVIGAVIDLGYCFDLLDSTNISILKKCYDLFIKESEQLHKPIPKNKDHPKIRSRDRILRYLDCAVIQYTHKFFDEKGEIPFDSVRAAFIEGDPIYPDAGFNEKTHIQCCIINPNCIKGFFLPRERALSFKHV
jgi:hypothetical protein